MLSADGDVILYEVDRQILNDFDNLIEEFYEWKKTSCYDEQLFVEFLQQKCGNEKIKLIKNLKKFDELPEYLKEIAILRLENPDASLKTLGEMLENPIGKSVVNHRLQKIHEIAEELKQRKY